MNQLESELLKLLSRGKKNQDSINKQIDPFITNYGLRHLKKWRNLSNKRNTFLHELVERDLPDVIRHVAKKYDFDLNIRRESDGIAPLQLAAHYKRFEDVCSFERAWCG